MPGILGTSLTADEMWDTIKSVGRGINLGGTSGLLGGPVDLATMLLNNPGMIHPGLLGAQGLGIENPVGGSKWIEQKLQPAGLLPKRQGNWQEAAGELASAFINPATAAYAAGPKLYAMESQMMDNALAPARASKQAGALFPPGTSKQVIQESADSFANRLREQGYQADLQHSGSAMGPSSYINVYDPQSGARLNRDLRFSAHDKGPYNAQFVDNISTPEDYARVMQTLQDGRTPENIARQQQARESANALAAYRENIAIQHRIKSATAKLRKGKQLTASEMELYNNGMIPGYEK